MKKLGAAAPRILVVEDEPSIGGLCQRVLTAEGFEVDIAVNGKVAKDMIEEKQYTLYLIDIKLPVMNGKEVYEWLQEKHPQLVSRVIFTTGSILIEDAMFVERAGRPFLPKPFSPDQLRAIVRQVARRKR